MEECVGGTAKEFLENSQRLTLQHLPDGKILTHWYIERIKSKTTSSEREDVVGDWNGTSFDGPICFIPVSGINEDDCGMQMKQYMLERGMINTPNVYYKLSRFQFAYAPYFPLFVTP